MNYVEAGGLRVADVFFRFINEEALPGTGTDQDTFWINFGAIVAGFGFVMTSARAFRCGALQSGTL